MKKYILSFTIAFIFTTSIKAQIYSSQSSEISFFSSSPIEDIDAKTNTSTIVMNTASGNIQVSIPIITFKFKDALMEEHFNENYLETTKYPKATFKGKVVDQTKVDYKKDGIYNVTVTGIFEIHGTSKEQTVTGTITVKGEQLLLNGSFNITLADYKIEVPSLYVKNIAESVAVKINATLIPFKKKQ